MSPFHADKLATYIARPITALSALRKVPDHGNRAGDRTSLPADKRLAVVPLGLQGCSREASGHSQVEGHAQQDLDKLGHPRLDPTGNPPLPGALLLDIVPAERRDNSLMAGVQQYYVCFALFALWYNICTL